VIRTRAENPGGEVGQIDSRTAIAGVAFDRQDHLWTVSRAAGAEIIATSPSLDSVVVEASWLEGQSVRGFSLSPGGSKVALLVQGSGQTRVLVSAIVRDLTGTPIELVEPIQIANELSNPTSVSWVDQITIAIVNTEAGTASALLSTIGGTGRQIPALPGTRSIVAAGVNSQLYLLTEEGELFAFRGSTWNPLRQSIRAFTLIN
jgi:hypothetical protein